MKALLASLLIMLTAFPAYAPPLPLFNFIVDGESVREGMGEKVCGILTRFYSANGVEGQCERRG